MVDCLEIEFDEKYPCQKEVRGYDIESRSLKAARTLLFGINSTNYIQSCMFRRNSD